MTNRFVDSDSHLSASADDKASRPRYFDDHAYSKQSFTISRQGHTRPTPQFGAPTLCWHVAMWPKQKDDPQHSRVVDEKDNTVLRTHTEVRAEYEEARQRLVTDFNKLIKHLQSLGRVKSANPSRARDEEFELIHPLDWHHDGTKQEPPHLRTYSTEFIGFTLWWPDSAADLPLKANAAPLESALRVRVQAEMNNDYQAITFYVDAGQPYNSGRIFHSAAAVGERRKEIFENVETVRDICEARIGDPDLIGRYLLPEPDGEKFAKDAKRLEFAANYLYEKVWHDFCQAFGIDILDIAGDTGGVYANFRSLIMSTNGVDVLSEDKRRHWEGQEQPLHLPLKTPAELTVDPAYAPFHRFTGLSGEEPKAVIKGFWPFLRRVRPEADYRDWIACGLFQWRVLFATSLGSLSELDPLDEGEYAEGVADSDWLIPAGHTPKRKTRHDGRQPTGGWDNDLLKEAPFTYGKRDRPAAFREFFLTKYEPHPRQIGRVVERFNSMGTFRLFALKNWSIIRDASTQIRMYGQELDAAIDLWVRRVHDIARRYDDKQMLFASEYMTVISAFIAKHATSSVGMEVEACLRGQGGYINEQIRTEIKDIAKDCQNRNSLRFKRLNGNDDTLRHGAELEAAIDPLNVAARRMKAARDLDIAIENQTAERRLIDIVRGLDGLGKEAIGGLHFRISRAQQYIVNFRQLVPSMDIGNIDTWISYEQVVRRGFEPAFRYLEDVGARLNRLRARLGAAMQSIQTSGIVNQTEATRDNTVQLELISDETRRLVDEIRLIAKTASEIKENQSKQENKILLIQKDTEEIRKQAANIDLRKAKAELGKVSIDLGSSLWQLGAVILGGWGFLTVVWEFAKVWLRSRGFIH